jgi:hypothetical protein
MVYSILSIYIALCSTAASLPSSLICIMLISAPSNIVDLYSTPLPMTYIVYSGTVATCTLSCNFICIRLWGKSSRMLKCIMSLPWATFLHCGASFRDPPYTLLQSNFIALTVVCDILNASSQCDWMGKISNWSWPMAIAPLHCEGFVALICILAFWRLHWHDMCGLHCVHSAFLALHSLLVGLFQCQHSVHLNFGDWIFWSLFIHVLLMLWLVFSSYIIDNDCQCYDRPDSCCFLLCHHHGWMLPLSAWLSQDHLVVTLFIS